jgi:hypothetical protein
MYKKHELMKHCSDLYKYSEELAKRLDAEWTHMTVAEHEKKTKIYEDLMITMSVYLCRKHHAYTMIMPEDHKHDYAVVIQTHKWPLVIYVPIRHKDKFNFLRRRTFKDIRQTMEQKIDILMSLWGNSSIIV